MMETPQDFPPTLNSFFYAIKRTFNMARLYYVSVAFAVKGDKLTFLLGCGFSALISWTLKTIPECQHANKANITTHFF